MAELTLEDFSGGITDFSIDGSPSQSEMLQNLMITKGRKLRGRPGSDLMAYAFPGWSYFAFLGVALPMTLSAKPALAVPQNPLGSQVINKMFVWQSHLWMISGTRLYYLKEYWYYTSTAGLPNGSVTGLVDHNQANGNKCEWTEVTFAFTAANKNPDAAIPSTTSLNAADVGLLSNSYHRGGTPKTRYAVTDLGSRLLVTSSDGMTPKYVYFPQPTGSNFYADPVLVEAGLPRPVGSTMVSDGDGGFPTTPGAFGHVRFTNGTSGSFNTPQVTIDAAIRTAAIGSATNFYAYAGCFVFTFTAHDQTVFTMRGPVQFFSNLTTAGTLQYYSGPITATNGSSLAVPWLAQDPAHPFGIQGFEVYRTKNAGSVFYYAGILNSNASSSTFHDLVPDANLGVQIYTTGGVLNYDPPPNALWHTLVDGTVWYINSPNGISNSADYSPNLMTQAIPGEPSGAPEDNTLFFDSPLVATSRVDIYPVVFEGQKCWRVEGKWGLDGSGGAAKRSISETVGCIAADGVINLGKLILFPSETGLYMTDGFSCTPLMMHLPKTWRSWTRDTYQRQFLFGRYLEKLNVCIWGFCPEASDTVSGNSASNVPTQFLVLHLDHGFDGGGKFTTWAASDFEQFTATDIIECYDMPIRADKRGYLMQHREQLTTDASFNTASNTISGTAPVIWDWRSCNMSMGSTTQRKWNTKLAVTTTDSPTAVSVDWGQALIINPGKIQIAGPGGAFPTDPTGYWPQWAVGYYIAFANENYANYYKITDLYLSTPGDGAGLVYIAVASDSLVTSTPVNGLTDWRIKVGNAGSVVNVYTARDRTKDYRQSKHINHYPTKPLSTDWRFVPAGNLRCTYRQIRLTNEDTATKKASARPVIESVTLAYEPLAAGQTAFQASDT